VIKDYNVPFSFRNSLLVYLKPIFIDNSLSLVRFDMGCKR